MLLGQPLERDADLRFGGLVEQLEDLLDVLDVTAGLLEVGFERGAQFVVLHLRISFGRAFATSCCST